MNSKKKNILKKLAIGKYDIKVLYTSTILKFNIIITNKNKIEIAPIYIIIINIDKNSAPNNKKHKEFNINTNIKYKTEVIEFFDVIINKQLIIINGLKIRKYIDIFINFIIFFI
jgi:hypothetical protein